MPRNKIVLKEKDYNKIRRLAKEGFAQTEIVKALGISYDTWLRIKEEDEKALQVFEEARKIEEDQLFNVLYQKAMEGDSTAAMFLLKTRHSYREGKEHGAGNAVQVNISVPGSMKPEEYKKAIEVNEDE